jgi:molybdopterin/thiamine biosynthesis adenylyltransferase
VASSENGALADDLVLRERSALIVGVGGLGCPAALALVRAGVGTLYLADDDEVELSNLHRQILYSEADIGHDKLDSARARLLTERRHDAQRIELIRSRLLPETAREMVQTADVVVEGSDNFATKFLAADATHLEKRPVVHGAAVRWRGTAWAVAPRGVPCYRCLFEDLPPDDAGLNCRAAGVMGAVVGVVGAVMAELALRILVGRPTYGSLTSYDGKRDILRAVEVHARPTCPLCGRAPRISGTEERLYLGNACEN